MAEASKAMEAAAKVLMYESYRATNIGSSETIETVWTDLADDHDRAAAMRRAGQVIRAFLDEAEGGPVRAAVLNTSNGAGETLLRGDMKYCQPEASAGLIGAAVIRALRAQAAPTDTRVRAETARVDRSPNGRTGDDEGAEGTPANVVVSGSIPDTRS